MKNNFYCSVTYKLLLLIYSVWIYFLLCDRNFDAFLYSLTYYTCQTNILIIIMLVIGIFTDLLYKNKTHKPKLYYILHSVFTVNGLFLIVAYWAIYSGTGIYTNMVDISHHFIIPLLMLFDLLIFNKNAKLKFIHGFLTCIPAVLYMMFAILVLYPMGICHYPEVIYAGMFGQASTWCFLVIGMCMFILFYTAIWLITRKRQGL